MRSKEKCEFFLLVRDTSSGMDKVVKKIEGTPFQKKVWQAIATIPYGETRSYQWIAQKIGNPKAVRAVGQACGANPLPLMVPCHRVVASNGKIGGFSLGLKLKRRLLKLEQTRR